MLMLAITYILLQGAPAIKKEEHAQGQGGISTANDRRLQGKITTKTIAFLPNSITKSYSKPWRLGATIRVESLTQVGKSLAAALAT